MPVVTRRIWTSMDDDVLRQLHANGRSTKWIARFMCVHPGTIHRHARELGIRLTGRHVWTPAEDRMLRRRYPDELTETIARDLGLSTPSVYNRAHLLGLNKSAKFFASDKSARIRRGHEHPNIIASRFKPGVTPWNKGKKCAPGRGGNHPNARRTQFKKGCMAGAAQHNYVPIGSERISKDGYLERKVTDDHPVPARRWVGVHRLVWEAERGSIPRKHMVRFKPGCHTTVAAEITVDKLELVSMAENMRRNSYHNYPQPIPRLIQLRGALNRKINRLEGKTT